MTERVYSSSDAYRQSKTIAGGTYQRVTGGFSQPIVIQHTSQFKNVKDDGTVEDLLRTWASYKLTQLPGYCGIAVSYNSFVTKEVREYGLGEHFHKERIQLCKDSGYSCMIATSIDDNIIQANLFEKNKWEKVHSFTNKRTKNIVSIWIKDI